MSDFTPPALILLVDDNPDDRLLAKRALNQEFSGLNFCEVIDQNEFETALKTVAFDLVITDYQLGWTTGIEVLERVRRQFPQCPVIMFTNTGTQEIAVEAMKAGLDDYVVKSPRHFVRLPQAVRSVWRHHLGEQEIRQTKQELRELNRTLEARIKERTAALEKANQELEIFTASISHDLRAPVRQIDGFVELLREELRDDPADIAVLEQRLDTLSALAQKAMAMIDLLLNFFRLEQLELRCEWVEMEPLVQQQRQELSAYPEAERITWAIAPLPRVWCDRTLIQLVWQNLLDNAIKFTATTPQPKIEISAHNKDGFVVFEIRDNGIGFEAADAERIFSVFRQIDVSSAIPKGATSGYGIGLASVRRIAQRHGGKAWASADPQIGSTFYVSLPLHESSQDITP